MPTSPPVCIGKRLRLHPFAAEHLTDRYVGWLNDPDVTRYSEQSRIRHTLESCRAYADSFKGTSNHFWAIVCEDAKLGHIGNLTVIVDTWYETADVAILIGEKGAWGRGYGREAFALACDYLLRDAGIRKVTAGTLAVNKQMLAIMRALGMQEDGVRRRQALHEGKAVDIVYAALFRDAPAHVPPTERATLA